MEARTFHAHFDGNQIQVDEPLDLAPNTELLITILPTASDEEDDDWSKLALDGLARVYGDDEPEYTLEMIRERNPDYEGR